MRTKLIIASVILSLSASCIPLQAQTKSVVSAGTNVTATQRSEARKTLEALAAVKDGYPMDLSDNMTMTDVYYTPATNTFGYKYIIKGNQLTVEMFQQSNNATKEATLEALMQDKETLPLVRSLIDAGASMVNDFYFPASGRHFIQTFSNTEIQNAHRKSLKPGASSSASADRYKDLDVTIRGTNAALPIDVDYMTKLITLSRSDDKLYYIYNIDESQYTVESLEPGKGVIRNSIISNLKQPGSMMFLNQLIDSGVTLIHRYVGTKTGQEMDIIFTPADLKTFR